MSTSLLVEIAQFAGVLAALIIVHELGHFIAARVLKVEVEEFGLGFPPRIATLFYAGKTRFSLNLIPFGGFVRPKGENDPSVPGGLAAASPWVRLGVLSAGPLANLLVGVLLYAVIFSRIGVPVRDQVKILAVTPDSPAENAGLLPGDLIVAVNDTVIDSTEALHSEVYANLDQQIEITALRDGQRLTVSLVPRSNPPEGEGAIGIVMTNPTKPVSVIAALPTGVSAVYQHSLALLSLPFQMIRGQIDPDEGRLVGFKGMFDIYQAVRESEGEPEAPSGINTFGFFATITISLGLLNLLPIPALDGGRILFLLPEILFRRRIPTRYENAINLVSFALLIMLMLFINLQDFVNPIALP
jgi:regulator of sigma E protease